MSLFEGLPGFPFAASVGRCVKGKFEGIRKRKHCEIDLNYQHQPAERQNL